MTNQTKHTHGPWNVVGGTLIIDSNRRFLGKVYESSEICGDPMLMFDETRANAKLIAAAPELLEACKEIDLAIGCNVEGISGQDYVRLQYIADEIEQIKQVIAKADGR